MSVPSGDDNVTPQGWGVVPTWLIRDTTVSRTSKVVYLILSSYVDRAGVCFPGQALVAEQAECSVRTVKRSIAELRRLGLVEVTTQRVAHGRRNIYQLTAHPTFGGRGHG